MTLTKSQVASLGTQAPGFSLPATDGKTYTLRDFGEKNVLVVFFTCNHCPYAQAAKPKIIDLWKESSGQSIQFVAINPNDARQYPEDDFEHMKRTDYDYPFPYLRDESQDVTRAYGAVCTPDIFLFDRDRRLAYRGQIDGDRPGLGAVAAKLVLGKELPAPSTGTSRDLANAIQAVLAGQKPDADQKPSMGCSIKWK